MIEAAAKAAAGGAGPLVLLLLLILGIALYFVPTVVAFTRKHQNAVAIFVTNLLLGWTFIGWVASLVWSLTNPQKAQTLVVHAGAQQQVMPPATPPPGWFADPTTSGIERWWDGQQWSAHVRPVGVVGAPPESQEIQSRPE